MEQTRPQELVESPAVQKFRFGAGIQASDGDAGTLVAVVVDGQSRALTQVGIRVHQFDRHLAYVPVDSVTSATAASISLGISRQEIEAEKSMPTGITLTRSTRVRVGQKIGIHTKNEDSVLKNFAPHEDKGRSNDELCCLDSGEEGSDERVGALILHPAGGDVLVHVPSISSL